MRTHRYIRCGKKCSPLPGLCCDRPSWLRYWWWRICWQCLPLFTVEPSLRWGARLRLRTTSKCHLKGWGIPGKQVYCWLSLRGETSVNLKNLICLPKKLQHKLCVSSSFIATRTMDDFQGERRVRATITCRIAWNGLPIAACWSIYCSYVLRFYSISKYHTPK